MARKIEIIERDGVRYGMIVRGSPRRRPIEFFTPDGDSLQVGAFDLAVDYVIKPHVHRPHLRSLQETAEVLIIESGLLQVDFYRNDRSLVATKTAGPGDIVILTEGGHGFTVLEDVRMIEVKQGPYAGGRDKIRFEPRTMETVGD